MGCLTTYLDLESLEIQRSSFDFKLNLTSVIGNLANCDIEQDMFPAIMPWPMTGVQREFVSREICLGGKESSLDKSLNIFPFLTMQLT